MSMAGSVPHYHRHMIVIDPHGNAETWPKKLESSDHVIAQYNQVVEPLNHAKNPKALIMAAAYPAKMSSLFAAEPASDFHDVLVFPENVRVTNVQRHDVEFLAMHLLSPTLDMDGLSARFHVAPLTGHHVFVCAHAQRDFRCACAGPKLIDWFHAKQPDDWTVYACSHFGGHRFAGNCIIYPEGHWYGLVNEPSDVDRLIAAVAIDKQPVVGSLWRGCIGETKAAQLQMHETRQ
ncbi:Aste57867_14045 [Aphanomyces stellatus]|uniref:Aste57867_14045 protein n=1 Tax=Aphanomyces stellatus TaxID=120398 RepID=A0A485KZP6_9STRA|nr:hypothetical protein As57867_013994 [Aphanomyces stellatus]VFT90875.1 Aste57867_14045 [Aphanomyces stellatus]